MLQAAAIQTASMFHEEEIMGDFAARCREPHFGSTGVGSNNAARKEFGEAEVILGPDLRVHEGNPVDSLQCGDSFRDIWGEDLNERGYPQRGIAFPLEPLNERVAIIDS
ncbi:MAG: hypothetical protein WBR26_21550 [Candidatus Acidiferrum sp.]